MFNSVIKKLMEKECIFSEDVASLVTINNVLQLDEKRGELIDFILDWGADEFENKDSVWELARESAQQLLVRATSIVEYQNSEMEGYGEAELELEKILSE